MEDTGSKPGKIESPEVCGRSPIIGGGNVNASLNMATQ